MPARLLLPAEQLAFAKPSRGRGRRRAGGAITVSSTIGSGTGFAAVGEGAETATQDDESVMTCRKDRA
jgi:hypothetical protein